MTQRAVNSADILAVVRSSGIEHRGGGICSRVEAND